MHGHKDRPTRGLRSQVTHARYTPTHNPTRNHTPTLRLSKACPSPAVATPASLSLQPKWLFAPVRALRRQAAGRGWAGRLQSRGSAGAAGRGARGRAARGHRLPGLKPLAPRARLPLPGSEGAGPDGEEGAGKSGGNYDDGAGVEPRMGASVLAAECNWFGGIAEAGVGQGSIRGDMSTRRKPWQWKSGR